MTDILLIDNNDSFTHLLGDLIWRAVGVRPRILSHTSPLINESTLHSADLIVISPGPGSPTEPADLGASQIAIAQSDVPVLGICLGHQAIAHDAGAKVARAQWPMHGLSSTIHHDGTGIFEGIESPMEVIRYHSLDVTDPTSNIEVLAKADDGTIMALKRLDRPQWGVQFHPESVGTSAGLQLMRNLIRATGIQDDVPTWHRSSAPSSLTPTFIADRLRQKYSHVCWLDSSDGSGTSLVAAGTKTVHPSEIPDGYLTANSTPAELNFVPGAIGALTYEASGGWDGTTAEQISEDERLLAPEVVYQWENDNVLVTCRAGSDPTEVGVAEADVDKQPRPCAAPGGQITFCHDRDEYVRLIEQCQDYIDAGESYELCLTTAAQAPVSADPFELYLRLREQVPAPMAGLWLSPERAILSASPERFLQVRGGTATASPIKGTRPRALSPIEDEAVALSLEHSMKDRAENIMIVDLLRNDLARTCRPGSIHVPELCKTYTFSHAHQLISTITAELENPADGLLTALQAFPGGSMTGAPKQRSMDILAELEKQPRGYYSGSMGYVSATGDVDFNILIRTAVLEDGVLSYGAGGAITRLSDPEAEFDEVMVKMLAFKVLLGVD